MEWLKVTVEADPQAEELVSNALVEAGALGVEISGSSSMLSRDVPVTWDIAEEKDESAPYCLSAYYSKQEQGDAPEIVAAGLQQLGLEPSAFAVRTELIGDENWATAWKEHFQPVRVGDFIVVKPTWVDYDAEPEQIIIEIDPGMAFGTGNHETTRLCLAMLENFVQPNETVVDVGCGSGVLSLAAAKLGAGHVYALDADPIAVQVTRENAELNGVADKVSAEQSDLLSALPDDVMADMVVCNIIADVIVRLAPQLPKVLRENGMFLCSGTIEGRLEDVVEALHAANMRIVSIVQEGEWIALACKYKR